MPRTDICKICFEPIEDNTIHSLFNSHAAICHDCFNKFKPVFKHFLVNGYKALAIYYYDEIIQEKLYQFKGCYDIELGGVFLEYFISYLRAKYRGYLIVPAPSYYTHDAERGFNHVEVIFSSLKLQMVKCVKKNKDIKQADLNGEQRRNIACSLSIDSNNALNNKKILIVDDVFTTGSTVKAMINLIKKCQPKNIQILVMSKTISPAEKG